MFIAKKSVKYLEKKFERKKKLGVLKGESNPRSLLFTEKNEKIEKKLHGKHTELLGIIQLGNQAILI